MTRYDAVIIGAGPAGLNAGLRLTSADSPPSVALIDRKTPWEQPIPCAEAVGGLDFEESLEIDPSWIRLTISKATFYSPDGAGVAYTAANRGFIIDRAKMQRDLAERLRTRGVDIRLGARVVDIGRVDDSGRRAVTLDNGESISAGAVIDASGPVSMFGKGEDICRKPYDLEPAYFTIAENVNCAEDSVHIYAGQKVAPGGYAWAFPRGGGAANVGVVIGRERVRGNDIRALLNNFLSKNFPGAEVKTYLAGPIPCGYRRGNIALPGLIKCGDAANAVNPVLRSGVSEALISGGLAGSAALDMLSAGDPGSTGRVKKICRDYEKAWLEKRGARHLKLAKVKGEMAKVPDEDYNDAVKALRNLSADKISMARIFGMSLRRFPRLVWALRHLV